ncbi:hypothetical protein BJY59DRAFT_211030 [Rhodotorula toruloides]
MRKSNVVTFLHRRSSLRRDSRLLLLRPILLAFYSTPSHLASPLHFSYALPPRSSAARASCINSHPLARSCLCIPSDLSRSRILMLARSLDDRATSSGSSLSLWMPAICEFIPFITRLRREVIIATRLLELVVACASEAGWRESGFRSSALYRAFFDRTLLPVSL